MDTIFMTNKEIKQLLKWRDKNKNLVREWACPLQNVNIICSDTNISIRVRRKEHYIQLDIRKIYYTKENVFLGNMLCEILPDNMYKIKHDTVKSLPIEDKQYLISMYSSLMAFLVYGTTQNTSKAERHLQHNIDTFIMDKEYKEHITYINGNRVYNPVITGHTSTEHHNSPNYSFTVRGHYRHYKNGKTVWVHDYVKGKGEVKDKTYKLSHNVFDN